RFVYFYYLETSSMISIHSRTAILLLARMCTSFFFFQAEDGIRGLTVTGVQTCALPISGFQDQAHGSETWCGAVVAAPPPSQRARSEERRVGKECRSRWWPKH